ncbi:RIP metalloprotease RseP [Roseovarius sp. TE539]|uniref:RIP metalloprotease RseP n=1 Tax=Roseovarius sp. TE539 TaxID=2249812 RepID=UPI000DDE4B43|nr:RIP metalloprotease RseP [Roseovarius sp. TE539]RBI77230.1 RIP metalloprotease RseP [Roseovarius sp. TE539]
MDIAALIPQFGNLFMVLLAFVVALSIIVAIHEYGHYIVGRWCGIEADVFSLGFGPVLWSRHDRRGTRWQVAALPFGGYVKFRGDADASSGQGDATLKAMSDEELRHTMHGAPLWARTATVSAGPLFNFVLSVLVFGAVMMAQGKMAEPIAIGEVKPLPGDEINLRAGDELLSIAGTALPDLDETDGLDEFVKTLPIAPRLDYGVRRDGREMTVSGPYPLPPLVTQLAPQSAAYEAGMRVGDVIIAVDGSQITAFSELKEIVEGSGGRALDLTIWNQGETRQLTLRPKRVDEPQPDGGFRTALRIGIAGGLAFEPATTALSPVEALAGGVTQTWRVITNSLSGLFHMITGAISSCNMSGPIGIAEVSGAMASQGVESFVWFVAVLSAAVGLLNLFPIPVLDGGHLVFYAFEAVAGRPPSDTALKIMMTVGLTLVLSLMAFALANDILCP